MTLATINTMLWDGILNMQTNSKLLRSGQYTLDTCVVTPLFAHVWPRTAGCGGNNNSTIRESISLIVRYLYYLYILLWTALSSLR